MKRRQKREKRISRNLLVLVIALILSSSFVLATFSLDKSSFEVNEIISGNLIIPLKAGELLPADSLLEISVDSQSYSEVKEILLQELSGLEIKNGERFYNEKSYQIGEGFGYEGEIVEYPNIDFRLELTPDSNSSGDFAMLVLDVEGSVNYNEPFTYNLGDLGESVNIVKRSASVDGEAVSESWIDIEINENQLIVSTDYSESISGFGEEFLGEDQDLIINLSLLEFNLTEGEYSLQANLVYGEEILYSADESFSVVGPLMPQIPPGADQPEDQPQIIEPEPPSEDTPLMPTIPDPEPIIDVEINEEIIQGFAEIGKPVKWTKKIKLSSAKSGLKVKLPKKAYNISIKKKVKTPDLQILDVEQVTRSGSNFLTGGVIGVNGGVNWWGKIVNFFRKMIRITGFAVEEDLDLEIEYVIMDEVEEVEVTYLTPGPEVFENEISERKKEIVVSSEVHYTNILTYTNINEYPQGSIRLYHLVNGVKQPTQITEYVDANNNGLTDQIKWITPLLSNQTYVVEIGIINVQSYPTVGGNWTVEFTTLGTADLAIRGINGTSFSEDLEFLELKCGNITLNESYDGVEVFYSNYSCDDHSGFETSKVLTEGKHTLEFKFGNETAYAYNAATHDNPLLSSTSGTNYSNENITCYNQSSSGGNTNVYNWYVDNVSLMILNMPFDVNVSGAGAGRVKDYSSYANNGSLSTPIWNDSGKVGGCYTFGGGDYIDLDVDDVGDDVNLNAGTMMGWGSMDNYASGSYDTLISVRYDANNRVFIEHYSNNIMYFSYTGGGTGDSVGIDVSSYSGWHHWALTWDKGDDEFKAYIDGVQVGTTQTGLGTLSGSSAVSRVGAIYDGSVTIEHWDGEIDEVQIYSVALSPQQIKQIYNDTNSGHTNNRSFVDQELSGGENWKCEIIPNNVTLDGTAKNSTELTIESMMSQDVPLLQSTSGTNYSFENITCYNQSSSHLDGSAMTNIYNWYKDGSSIAVLNLPFDMNESSIASGKIKDYSSRGHNATLGEGTAANAPSWNSSGKVGGAYSFDGTTDYISLPDSDDWTFGGDGSFTISAWYYLDDLSSPRALFSHATSVNTYYQSDVNTDGTWRFYHYVSGSATIQFSSSAGAITTGSWLHLAFVKDGTDFVMYRDGVNIGNTSDDTPITNFADIFAIGALDYVSGRIYYFDGKIDEFTIYNQSFQSFSQQQIKQMYEDANGSYTNNRTILSQELTVGESWTCEIIPNDLEEDGGSKNSSVEILSPMSQDAPLLESSSRFNNVGDNLTCYNQSSLHANGIAMTNIYNWYVDNRSITVLNLPFDMNESSIASGAVNDYSGIGHDATLGEGTAANAPSWNSSGKVGGAYSFDGTTDYISVPDSDDWTFGGDGNFTIAAWYYIDDLSSPRALFSHATDVNTYYQSDVNTDGTWRFYHYVGGSLTIQLDGPVGGVITGAWQHLVLMKNGTTFNMYKNGTSIASVDDATPITNFADIFAIGALDYVSGRIYYFDGKIDEFTIYNQSFSFMMMGIVGILLIDLL